MELQNLKEEGGERQKFEDLESEKSFLDEIKSIFSQFVMGFLSVKYT